MRVSARKESVACTEDQQTWRRRVSRSALEMCGGIDVPRLVSWSYKFKSESKMIQEINVRCSVSDRGPPRRLWPGATLLRSGAQCSQAHTR